MVGRRALSREGVGTRIHLLVAATAYKFLRAVRLQVPCLTLEELEY